MVSITLYILSAFIMFLFEFFVLLRLYKRSKILEYISLLVAPLMIVLALFITNIIQKSFTITNLTDMKKSITYVNPLILFFVLVLLELPLSLYGYELTPNASIPERLIVAGVFGVSAVLIAQAIVGV